MSLVLDSPGQGQLRISGSLNGTPFGPITLKGVLSVILDTSQPDGGSSGDTIVLKDLRGSGVQALRIRTGPGDNQLILDGVEAGTTDGAMRVDWDAGSGANTLWGPQGDTTWTVTGKNSGSAAGVGFQGVEFLKGAANNRDTFVFAPGGSISGWIDGGDGGFDSLVIQGGDLGSVQFLGAGPHSGTVILDGNPIRYFGLEPITLTGSGSPDVTVTGSDANDQLVLEADPSHAGSLRVRSLNGTIESVSFPDPSNSLTINLGNGNDTLAINALDPGFGGSLTVKGGSGVDEIDISQNVQLKLPGHSLSLSAQTIRVNTGVTINTTKAGGNGTISLTAVDTQTGTNGSANTLIQITGATITGGDITISASSTETPSATGSALELINAQSHAQVSINNASHVTSSGKVTVTAASTVTATATAQVGSGGSTSVDAAVANSTLTSSAIAHVAGSLAVTGTLGIWATNTVTVTTSADGSQGGSGAMGGVICTASVTSVTQAYINGNGPISASAITVSATSNNNVPTSVKSTANGASQNSAGDDPSTKTQGNAQTSDGTIGVAAALAFTSLSSQTQAYVAPGGATITAGSLKISSNSTDVTSASADGSSTQSSSGSSGSSGSPGFGVAVAVNLDNVLDEAYIGGTVTLAVPSTTVEAIKPSASSFTASAISGAGAGGSTTFAGAFAFIKATDQTDAVIKSGANVTATGGGGLTFTATNLVSSSTTAKPAQAGQAGCGIGASVALTINDITTRAEVEDTAVLSGAKDLSLAATLTPTVLTDAEAGAGGTGTTVGGAAALTIADNKTSARIGTATGTMSLTGLSRSRPMKPRERPPRRPTERCPAAAPASGWWWLSRYPPTG